MIGQFGPVVAVAMRGEVGEGPLHRVELRDLGLKRRNVPESHRLDVHTRARAVAPQGQKLGDLLHGEAEIARAADEAQRVDVCRRVFAVARHRPRRRGPPPPPGRRSPARPRTARGRAGRGRGRGPRPPSPPPPGAPSGSPRRRRGGGPRPPRSPRPGRDRSGPAAPVLSSATIRAARRLWSASPFRNRTPISAARPVPTMMEVGVARPIAQGQAMISTATALTSAKVSAGAGP
jgi:hypothetical protein